MECVTLNTGRNMPLLGFGTYPLNGWPLALLIRRATHLGYRCIDTAAAYSNERWIGVGLACSPIPRADLFITTKLSNGQQRHGDVRGALKSSLSRLRLKYVDLYLMHWPQPSTFRESWKQMECLYREGYALNIGVCNFHEHHIEALLETADIMPAINQVELHPLLSQQPLVQYCTKRGIQVEAYSPLAQMHVKLIKNSTLIELADKHSVSVPQVVLRWLFQKRIIAIPRSSSISRLAENMEIKKLLLRPDEMRMIDNLNENMRVRHNPDTCDFNVL